MKSQTHYQVITQTAGQVENKNRQYLPHKWRGNTLVPVIIALAISAIATIAFLNQGASLAADNKLVLANNEIAEALSDWAVLRTSNSTNLPANRSNIFEGSGSIKFNKLATGYAAQSTGLKLPAMAKDAPYMIYQTDIDANCNALRDRLPSIIDGVSSRACINSDTPSATSTAGKYLLIILE